MQGPIEPMETLVSPAEELERAESCLRQAVESVQAWIDVIRDEARDLADPEE